MSDLTRQEKMSADDKIIAFDFQYDLFMLELFKMKVNETVGFEYKEDVHIEHTNGNSSYIQVKHTVDNKNITTKDRDLWKTIWSWLIIICDENLRPMIEDQLTFINETEFILLTNKKGNKENNILTLFDNYRKGKVIFEELETCLRELISTKEQMSDIDKKIITILQYDKNLLTEFFKKLKFETDYLDVKQEINEILDERCIPKHLQEGIYSSIYFAVRKRLEKVVKERKHLSFRQEEFSVLFQRFAYGDKIKARVYRDFDLSVEESPNRKMTFIRQLDDIDIIDIGNPEDQRRILRKYESKLLYEKNKLLWIQSSELPEELLNEIEEEAINTWENKFYRFYKNKTFNNDDKVAWAQKLYYEIEETTLDFSIEVDYQKGKLGEGVFLSLSDIPKIGWHIDWEENYIHADL